MNTKKKSLRILAFAFLILSAAAVTAPSSQASIESIENFGTTVLDGIENVVIKSGLVDLKKKAWKDLGLLIKPYFKTRYVLTSNVFKEPDVPDTDRTDNVFSFTPGFQAVYKMDKGVLGAAYEATFRYFAQFEEQNTADQNFLVYANLFPTEDTYVRVSNRLKQEGATAGNSAFKPIDIKDNTVNVVVGRRLNDRWTAEFGYENYHHDFQNQIANVHDYNEHKFDERVYYQINDNVRAYSGFRLGLVSFHNNPSRDTLYWEIPVGIEGKLIWGINVLASVGIHRRNLEDSNRNDVTSVVTNLALERQFNDGKTLVSGGFLRRPVESSFSSATTYDEKLWYLNAKHLITSSLRGRAGMYWGNRDFEERITVGPRVIVGGRVFAVSPVTVVKRDDSVFGINLGVDYNVRKWLILHMDYAYNRRNSNISQLDYTENVFSLGSTIPL